MAGSNNHHQTTGLFVEINIDNWFVWRALVAFKIYRLFSLTSVACVHLKGLP